MIIISALGKRSLGANLRERMFRKPTELKRDTFMIHVPIVNILLVGDDPKTLAEMQTLLGFLGEIGIRSATDHDLLEAALIEEFAVIILDNCGPDAAALIRSCPLAREVPLIFLTAGDEEKFAEAELALGVIDCVRKPVQPALLKAKVHMVVEFFRNKAALQSFDTYAMGAVFNPQNELWQTTLSSIGDAVIATDCGRQVLFLNAAAEQLTGWKRSAALGRNLDEVFVVVNEDTRQKIACPVKQVLATGREAAIANHTLLISQKGDETPIDDSAKPIRNEEGNLFGAVLVFRDIREKTDAARALKSSEERLRLATDASDLGVWVWHIADDRVTWENDQPYEIFGIPRGGEPLNAARFSSEFLHPDDLELFQKSVSATLEEGTPFYFIGRFRRGDGEIRWTEFKGQLLHKRDGTPDRILGTAGDVTERKLSEDRQRQARDPLEIHVTERTVKLDKEKQFLQAVLENIEDGIVACDADGLLTLFNQATKSLHGLPPQPLAPEHRAQHYNLFTADGRTPMSKAEVPLFRALAGENVQDAEMVIAPTHGERRTLLASGQALYDEDGKKLGAVVSMHNITDRENVDEALAEVVREQALRQADERVRGILESISDGVFLVDEFWEIIYVNKGAEVINSQSRDELLGNNLWKVFPTTIGTMFQDEVMQVFLNRVPRSFQYFYEPWGKWFQIDASPAPDGGTAIYYRDVTEQKRDAETLIGSEKRFRLLAETIPNLAWMAQPDGHIFWYNQRWYDYTGTTEAEMQGWGWRKVQHPEEMSQVMERWLSSIDTGEPFKMVFPLLGADGLFRHFLTLVNPFRDASGTILFWFGTNTDITEQKNIEQKLALAAAAEKERSRLLTQVAEASSSINAVLSISSISGVLADEARRILKTNVSLVSLAPRSRSDEPAHTVSLSDNYRELRAREFKPEELGFEINPWLLNNETYENLMPQGKLVVPLIGHGGRRLGLIQLLDKFDGDFTEEDEAVLSQLAATAAVGLENAHLYDSLREQDQRKDEFLATLAHELRNPLAPVRTGLEILKRESDQDRAKVARDMMERQLGLMVRLVDDLMDVSRVSRGQMELKPERATLDSIIQSALETSLPLVKSAKHEFFINLPDEPLHVMADRTRLAQVLSNLINNAAKYTPPGGRIDVTAYPIGVHIFIDVKDNGSGIPGEMLSKIFDMFTQVGRTLDRAQGGLGIGLSLVKQLVEMHGGSVTADSPGLGLGSTFTVKLPALSKPSDDLMVQENELADDSAPGRSHRVLVVDDNLDGAESLAMLLQIYGHETRTAHAGDKAIELANEFRPEVIFLDIGLPGMNGYEVARRIRANPEHQGITLVAVTGWGSEEDRKLAREAGYDRHMTKPVDPAAVMKAMASLPR